MVACAQLHEDAGLRQEVTQQEPDLNLCDRKNMPTY
jgi:hypothetical protein